jgi:peptidoglycan/xylan/chitin deacetylase (PgdA/CDA1 family)
MAGSCLVVMYHYVRDSQRTAFPSIRALHPDAFAQQLDWLQDNYQIVTQQEIEAAIDGSGSLPGNPALLTFDDGFVDHYTTVFPMLSARGLTGVFFVAEQACAPRPRVLGVHKTHFLLAKLGAEAFGRAVLDECTVTTAAGSARQGRVFGADRWEHADERAIKDLLNYELSFEDADRVLDTLFARHLSDDETFARSLYLDAAMIGEMARGGMVFGHHTRSHRMLSRLTPQQQRDELEGGVEWIRALTGRSTVSFCYPWGGPKTYSADTLRILAETGYSVAYNTVRRRADVTRDGRFELPRVDTRDLPPHTFGELETTAAPLVDEA